MERSASSKLCWLLSKNTLFTCSFQIGQFSARPKCDFFLILFFFSLFFSLLSQCNLAGFSGVALHLHVDIQWGSCFLFWQLKPNIPPIDLYIPPPLCLKIFVYSSANVQAGHSNQKWQIWPDPKCILLKAMSENTLPLACSSQACLALKMIHHPDLNEGWDFPYPNK